MSILPPPAKPPGAFVEEYACPTCAVGVVRTTPGALGSFFHCGQQWMFKAGKVWAHSYDRYDADAVYADSSMSIKQKIEMLLQWGNILDQNDRNLSLLLKARTRVRQVTQVLLEEEKKVKIVGTKLDDVVFTSDKEAQLKVWTLSLNTHAGFMGEIPPGKNVQSLCIYARKHGLEILPWIKGSSLDPEHKAEEPQFPSRLLEK